MAGLYYGIDNIPGEWINTIPQIEYIMCLAKDAVKMKTDYIFETMWGKQYNILIILFFLRYSQISANELCSIVEKLTLSGVLDYMIEQDIIE